MAKFISYLRVSTDKQGKSGLGLEAQREMVSRYIAGANGKVVREYVETESGRKAERPKLRAALAHAKSIKATVVFAKLDRLTRDVDLLRALVNSGADLVFCDFPNIPAGAMGRFLLTQMASVAELEAGLVSERTKAALAAAKARGIKLGNPNGARALKGKQTGNREALAVIRENAQRRAEDALARIEEVRLETGAASFAAIAKALNERGERSPRGGLWYPASVARVLERTDSCGAS